VRLLLGIIFALAVAAVVGLGTTWLTSRTGSASGAVRIGAWTAWPKSGTSEIDPYARATVARSGTLPIGSGDGVLFIANVDDAGQPLDGRCEVTVSGTTPPARYWTLTLYDPQGFLIANAANRYGFTSQEVVRDGSSAFRIAVAPRARPGNWLPSGGATRYVLVLRLYDTPVGVGVQSGREMAMPSITNRVCP
jgi:hypothetical protein